MNDLERQLTIKCFDLKGLMLKKNQEVNVKHSESSCAIICNGQKVDCMV